MRYYDEKVHQSVIPLEPNGYKFELSIHDCYLLCDPEKFGIIEAIREDEYAPVKNAPGESEDTPDTAKELMSQLHQRWLKRRSIEIEGMISLFICGK